MFHDFSKGKFANHRFTEYFHLSFCILGRQNIFEFMMLEIITWNNITGKKLTCETYRLLYVAPGLPHKKSTFSTQRSYGCFVWISEKTAVFQTTLTDWFLQETGCVYYGAGTKF